MDIKLELCYPRMGKEKPVYKKNVLLWHGIIISGIPCSSAFLATAFN